MSDAGDELEEVRSQGFNLAGGASFLGSDGWCSGDDDEEKSGDFDPHANPIRALPARGNGDHTAIVVPIAATMVPYEGEEKFFGRTPSELVALFDSDVTSEDTMAGEETDNDFGLPPGRVVDADEGDDAAAPTDEERMKNAAEAKAHRKAQRKQRARQRRANKRRRLFYEDLQEYEIGDTPAATAPFYHDILTVILPFVAKDPVTLVAVVHTCRTWRFFGSHMKQWTHICFTPLLYTPNRRLPAEPFFARMHVLRLRQLAMDTDYRHNNIHFGLVVLLVGAVVFASFMAFWAMGVIRNRLESDSIVGAIAFWTSFGLCYILMKYVARNAQEPGYTTQRKLGLFAGVLLVFVYLGIMTSLMGLRFAAMRDLTSRGDPVLDSRMSKTDDGRTRHRLSDGGGNFALPSIGTSSDDGPMLVPATDLVEWAASRSCNLLKEGELGAYLELPFPFTTQYWTLLDPTYAGNADTAQNSSDAAGGNDVVAVSLGNAGTDDEAGTGIFKTQRFFGSKIHVKYQIWEANYTLAENGDAPKSTASLVPGSCGSKATVGSRSTSGATTAILRIATLGTDGAYSILEGDTSAPRPRVRVIPQKEYLYHYLRPQLGGGATSLEDWYASGLAWWTTLKVPLVQLPPVGRDKGPSRATTMGAVLSYESIYTSFPEMQALATGLNDGPILMWCLSYVVLLIYVLIVIIGVSPMRLVNPKEMDDKCTARKQAAWIVTGTLVNPVILCLWGGLCLVKGKPWYVMCDEGSGGAMIAIGFIVAVWIFIANCRRRAQNALDE